MRRKSDRDRFPLGECVRFGVHGSEYVDALPFYKEVPKDYDEQLDFRLRIREAAASDPVLQRQLWQACRDDVLFFINAFAWIIEPRESKILPFNTWPHQDVVIAPMAKYLGKRDMKGDKSRAQGASWIGVAVFAHRFLFFPNSHLGCVSKDMDMADDPANPDSLGWKFDFLFSMLPTWMQSPGLEAGGRSNRNLSQHTWTNVLNGSSIKCYAATETVARGGRRLAFLFDEVAYFPPGKDHEAYDNLRSVTDCRILMSTPFGTTNLFYKVMHRTDRSLKFILDWEDNPDQSRGKYVSIGGKMQIIDKLYEFPHDFDFIPDGIVRSPWFDAECERAGGDMTFINRELRRNYEGSRPRPFSEGLLAACSMTVRDPQFRGDFFYEPAALGEVKYTAFVPNPDGKVFLWMPLDLAGLPPQGTYTVGADIAAGTAGGTSNNSSLAVYNGLGEQVLEYASNSIDPVVFAQLTVALCYWLGRGESTVFLCWEKNGTAGTQYSDEIMRLGYPNVYWFKDRTGNKHERPGYHTAKTHEMLSPLVAAFQNRQISPRSQMLLNECGQYTWDQTGRTWVHPGAVDSLDPSSRGLAHGDRAVASAMAVIAMNERNLLREAAARIAQKKAKDPYDEFLADRRRRARDAELATCRW